jgi:Uma2 family endonuclease
MTVVDLRIMSDATGKQPATYEDLVALPSYLVGEIVDGELIVSPRPGSLPAAAKSSLGADLQTTFGRSGGGRPGGWVILDEPELHVAGQVMVPDLAGWRRERMPQLPDVAFFELAPDRVCEVHSPSTIALDRTRKTHHYARAGVGHLWFLDPGPQTLEISRLEGGGWRLVASVAGNEKIRAEPFEVMELDLAGVWAR